MNIFGTVTSAKILKHKFQCFMPEEISRFSSYISKWCYSGQNNFDISLNIKAAMDKMSDNLSEDVVYEATLIKNATIQSILN